MLKSIFPSLFNARWQTPRDGVSIKILVPITKLGWGYEGHPIINFCYISIYKMTKSIDRPKYLNDIGIFQSKNAVHGRNRVSRPAILAKIFGQLVVFLHNFDSPQAKRHLTTSIVNFGTRVVSQVPKDCDLEK